MFERFTQPARDAVLRAQTEARELRHNWIGTEHILLALLDDDDGPVAAALRADGVNATVVRAEIASRVNPHPSLSTKAETDAEDKAALQAIGIDLDAVRAAIEENFGAGSLRLPPDRARKPTLFGRLTSTGRTPFTKRAKKVLELALREAMRLQHKFIAPEHLLLGILREGNGLAMVILTDQGVEVDRLRSELTRSMGNRAA